LPKVAKVVFDVDGEPVRPALSKPALKLGPFEASRVMRRKRADFHQGQERGTTLRFKAGYMAATGFSHSSIYNLAHGPGPYKLQRTAALKGESFYSPKEAQIDRRFPMMRPFSEIDL
jgi:hypothetical protein